MKLVEVKEDHTFSKGLEYLFLESWERWDQFGSTLQFEDTILKVSILHYVPGDCVEWFTFDAEESMISLPDETNTTRYFKIEMNNLEVEYETSIT